MNATNRISLFMILLSFAVLSQTGCDSEKVNEMVAKAKETAGDLADKGKEAINKGKEAVSTAADSASQMATNAGNLVQLNGNAKITLDSPSDFPASFVRVIPLANGTNVLQVKSYKDGQEDSYPSYLLQGVTDQISVDSLSGKSVPCQFYAQQFEGGSVWKNADAQPVVLQFQKVEDKLTASFKDAAIVNLESGSEVTGSGTFECVTLE